MRIWLSSHKLWILLIGVLLFGVFGFLITPSFERYREHLSSSYISVYDREDKILAKVRSNFDKDFAEWVSLDQISEHMQNAVILQEDKRFFKHFGVDFMSIGSSFKEMIQRQRRRGASTISMQLAKFVFPIFEPMKPTPVLVKPFQILAAMALELRWSKKQILEAYLNSVWYRGELQGVQAASQTMFAKDPHGLTRMEGAILASFIRGHHKNLRRVARLTCATIRKMDENVSCKDILPSLRLLASTRQSLSENKSFETLLVGLKRKSDLHSTIDGRVQEMVSETLMKQLIFLQLKNVRDAAALVIENQTGHVVAYVNHVALDGRAEYVDGILAKRQAGSTLKPFLYGAAIENKILTASSILNDQKVELVQSGAIYAPENYDHRFRGFVTVRDALSGSLNIPAVLSLQLLGGDLFVDVLRQFGFDVPQNAEYYGPSLALGSLDVSLYELTQAYSTLARGGKFKKIQIDKNIKPTEERQVLSEQASFIVSSIMSDRSSRVATFGLGSPLETKVWSAVKTGTSKEMRDNWCVGFSKKYTVGVWFGNFDGVGMWDVTGVTGAAPAWQGIFDGIHEGLVDIDIKRPEHVVQKRISVLHKIRDEFYLEGTEPDTDQVLVSSFKQTKFYAPLQGATYAFDPHISEEMQEIPMELRGDFVNVKLNGKKIHARHRIRFSDLHDGMNRLTAFDPQGNLKDVVEFKVVK